MDEFTSLFGSSSAITLATLTAYFQNLKRALYFVKVAPNPIGIVTLGITAPGTYGLTIGGVAISVSIPASPPPTAQSVIETLIAEINNNTTINQLVQAEYRLNGAGLPVYADFFLRSKDGNIFSLTSAGPNLVAGAVAAPATLGYLDWVAAIDRLRATEEESDLGFLVCPQAFYSLTNQFERTVVGNAMEQSCRSLGWMALIDPGAPSVVDHPIRAKLDAAGYTAIRGHSAYYYPYLKNASVADVAPSAMVAAFALQCYENLGIQKPPAGSNYPFRGIAKVAFQLTQSQRDDLATARINTILFKAGVGFVPGDTLTRSIDPNFKMISTRVIMSCIERTIQQTLDVSGLLFESVGGSGLFFIRLKQLLEGVLARFYEGEALYGDRPEDAYSVKCDASIQQSADLEAGIVNSEIFVVPAATARQIRGVVFRVPIGNIPQALLGRGL
jgi:hypothetical protein